MTAAPSQISGGSEASNRRPWADHERAADKDRLLEVILEKPEGVPLPWLIRTVFGSDTDLAGADADVARRVVENHPDLFETARRDGFVWISDS